MPYKVFVSRTFQKQFHQLQTSHKNRILKALHELCKDPYTSRPNCDIKVLKETHPKKYRLRVGDYRIIFFIEENTVKIIKLLKRERGYGRLE